MWWALAKVHTCVTRSLPASAVWFPPWVCPTFSRTSHLALLACGFLHTESTRITAAAGPCPRPCLVCPARSPTLWAPLSAGSSSCWATPGLFSRNCHAARSSEWLWSFTVPVHTRVLTPFSVNSYLLLSLTCDHHEHGSDWPENVFHLLKLSLLSAKSLEAGWLGWGMCASLHFFNRVSAAAPHISTANLWVSLPTSLLVGVTMSEVSSLPRPCWCHRPSFSWPPVGLNFFSYTWCPLYISVNCLISLGHFTLACRSFPYLNNLGKRCACDGKLALPTNHSFHYMHCRYLPPACHLPIDFKYTVFLRCMFKFFSVVIGMCMCYVCMSVYVCLRGVYRCVDTFWAPLLFFPFFSSLLKDLPML